MKKLKYIIFIFILFLTPNVFALGELNGSSYSQANSFNYSSRYDYSTDNYLGDQTNFSVGTLGDRYSGKAYYFQFNFHYNILASKMYDVKFSSDGYDFTNQINSDRVVPLCYSSFAYNFNTKECNDISVVSVKRGSTSGGNSKDFTIRIVSGSNHTYWGFKIAGGFYNLTSVNNFKIGNISLTEVDNSNTNEIINNQNQNTQDIINNSTSNSNNIIDNQNQNTNNIINNQNQNTQDVINNEKELLGNCIKNYMTSSSILSTTNLYTDGNNFQQITADTSSTLALVAQGYDNSSFVRILNSTTVSQVGRIKMSFTKQSDFNVLFYKLNGITQDTGMKIDVSNLTNNTTYYISSEFFNLTQGDIRFRNIMITDVNTFDFVPWGQEKCTSKLDSVNSSIDNMNNYMQDDSNPNISNSEFTTLFDSVNISNPLSSLLQLPVQFINALVNQTNSCQVVNLGTLWGVNISLPCINIGSILGQNVWDTIDVLSSIGLIVLILKQLYESITNALTLGGYMDAKRYGLGYMPPLEFLCDILTGFGGYDL